jgi:hypothetical protein
MRPRLWLRVGLLVMVGGAGEAGEAEVLAQDSVAVIRDSVTAVPSALAASPADTLYSKAPISPMGGFWRSLLIPGWGQAKVNRKLTGALFVAWEGVTLGMSIKTSHELSYLRAVGSERVKSKEKEQQDWLVLLGFNHLFSAIEAYVSSHLWEFPSDLEINAAPTPGGGFGASVSLPFRLP